MPSVNLYTVAVFLLALVVILYGSVHIRRTSAAHAVTEASLREHADQLRTAMQGSADGVLLLRAIRDATGTVSDFQLLDLNPTAAALLRQPRETLLGARTSTTEPIRCNTALFADYVHALETGIPINCEMRVSPRRFATSWLWHQAVPVPGGIVVTIRDIAERKKEAAALRHASLTDELTLLSNRRGFLTLAEQQLRSARRQGRDLVLLFADIDGFKHVNDTFGHAAGDRTLQAVAHLLRASVRDSDIVARLGGDEFTVLAVDGDRHATSAIIRRIGERIATLNRHGRLDAPLSLSIGELRVTAAETASLEELLANADALLYKRKAQRPVGSLSSNAATMGSSAGPSSNRRHHGRTSSSLLRVRTT